MSAICRTCGDPSGHHVPSPLDPNGIGNPGHRMIDRIFNPTKDVNQTTPSVEDEYGKS